MSGFWGTATEQNKPVSTPNKEGQEQLTFAWWDGCRRLRLCQRPAFRHKGPTGPRPSQVSALACCIDGIRPESRVQELQRAGQP